VPEALPIPADLVDLQRAVNAARDKLYDYVARVEAERREQFPAPEQIVERRTWPEEQIARADELREAERTAATAVWNHPTMVQALAERCYHQTDVALREAAAEAQ
jgi:hypothetical protein